VTVRGDPADLMMRLASGSAVDHFSPHGTFQPASGSNSSSARIWTSPPDQRSIPHEGSAVEVVAGTCPELDDKLAQADDYEAGDWPASPAPSPRRHLAHDLIDIAARPLDEI
jgi:hypothetical protein